MDRPALRFRDDGAFTIVQLTDLHARDGGTAERRTVEVVAGVLDEERPDLVVLTGDVVDGGESPDPGAALRRIVAPIEDRGLSWALTFGNHDDEGALSRLDLLAVAREHPGCLTERGPDHVPGVGNGVLGVLSARRDALAAALYLLDSGGNNARGIGDYDWISPDQVAWYVASSRALARDYAAAAAGVPRAERLPALAFFHIPLPEYLEVWQTRECRGFGTERVCAPVVNSGFLAALVERGDVMGTFAGHDHLNDYEGELWGVRLCFGRATGHGGYGREGFLRGARVVRLREGERTFESWIRLEDGSIAERPVHLPAMDGVV